MVRTETDEFSGVYGVSYQDELNSELQTDSRFLLQQTRVCCMKELDADINDDNLTLTSVCKEEELLLLLDGCEHQR